MNLSTLAQDLLDAAVASGVTVDRAIVAAGPDWAADCRMIAVHVGPVAAVPPTGILAAGPGLGMCAWVPQVTVTVSFVDDCVPTGGDDGQPPSPSAITAHAVQYLADVETIWHALSEWVADQDDCDAYQILETIQSGPLGQTAKTQIPIQATLTGELSPAS